MNPLNEQTYKAHKDALEGKVFYYNKLAEPGYAGRYFPTPLSALLPSAGRDGIGFGYDSGLDMNSLALSQNDPKVSLPFSGNVINRIASLVYKDASITVTPGSLQPACDAMLARNGWPEFGRDIVVKMLFGSTCLVVPFPTARGMMIDTYTGEWTYIEQLPDKTENYGIMYTVNNEGDRIPITGKPDGKDKVFISKIGSAHWDENAEDKKEHNLGYSPAVMFESIDMTDESVYPMPFHMRYKSDLIQLNQVFSKVIKDVKALTPVWTTNKNQDGLVPILLDTNILNFLGTDGKLEQVISEYKIDAPRYLIETLQTRISTSAQVPDFMTGLRDVGKIESGVALSITHAPLMELIGRVVSTIKPKLIELIAKMLYAELILTTGSSRGDFMIELDLAQNIIPADKEREVRVMGTAIDKQIIAPQEARPVVLPLLGIEETGIKVEPMESEDEDSPDSNKRDMLGNVPARVVS